MGGPVLLGFLCLLLAPLPCRLSHLNIVVGAPDEGPWYDYSASTECKPYPDAPLYNGGILPKSAPETTVRYHRTENMGYSPAFVLYNLKTKVKYHRTENVGYSPAFVLYNLTETTRYSFSCWVKIEGTDSAPVKASLSTDTAALKCIGTAMAKSWCWSFLKGGFVLDSSSETSVLYFKTDAANNGTVEISIASASLQPFSVEQWKMHQQDSIKTKRKRTVTIHVSDAHGNRINGASVSVKQLSKDFPFGSAIAKTILGNDSYQAWFVERFNAAVFENELKWYATEPEPGKVDYSSADEMLEFVRANQILVRGHNIFWEDPMYTPAWVRNLSGDGLRAAVASRIESLLSRYRGDFVHWDVSNEMLHFDFYEQRLGRDASLHFFATAREADPLATLFMNDFNVVETCDDANSTVDSYVSRLRELKRGGASLLAGIGLEGHFFSKPNLPLMRAVLDKLATLKLPIWLTEVDVSKAFDHQTQGIYLEEVLREGFSHPSVNGMMLWTALHPYGCYEMCLTDGDFNNLPAGDVVDRLLGEWETGETGGVTGEHGSYSFSGFLGEYKVSATYGNRSTEVTLSLCRGDETRHLNVQLIDTSGIKGRKSRRQHLRGRDGRVSSNMLTWKADMADME